LIAINDPGEDRRRPADAAIPIDFQKL